MATTKKKQLNDVQIEKSRVKEYGVAYCLQKQLEGIIEACKKEFKEKMEFAYAKIPDEDKIKYECSFTVDDIKFNLTTPLILNPEKMKTFLKNKLNKANFKKAVKIEPVYEINKEKLKENKDILKSLIDNGILVKLEDNYTIDSDVVSAFVHEGLLVQSEIDKECKQKGSPTLRLSGKGLDAMKDKASKWIDLNFEL